MMLPVFDIIDWIVAFLFPSFCYLNGAEPTVYMRGWTCGDHCAQLFWSPNHLIPARKGLSDVTKTTFWAKIGQIRYQILIFVCLDLWLLKEVWLVFTNFV